MKLTPWRELRPRKHPEEQEGAVRKSSLDEALRMIVREEIAASLAVLDFGTHEPLPTLLTSEQLARELGVSVVHVRKLVNDGTIPAVAVGDCKRFELDAVLTALKGARR